MILTEYVIFRGKNKKVEELSPTSGMKVDVQCPECKEVRNVHYRSICTAGHTMCQKCSARLKMGKTLKIGEKFNSLKVVEQSEKTGYSIFECDCGSMTEKRNWNVTSGKTTSCGCMRSENMKKIGEYPKGDEHWNWKGGITGERHRTMQSKKYKDWRSEVFKRDDHTCQKCGQVGYEIRAHHIHNYADYPKLRFDIDNGITFCEECHREFHGIYGNKTNKKQLNEFIER